MYLAPYHGWITGLPVVFFDQSQPSLLELSRLPCDWSILSLFYPPCRSTWRNFADEFLSAVKCVLERFHIDKFMEIQQDAILNLLKRKDVIVSQPTGSGKFVIFSPSRSSSESFMQYMDVIRRWPFIFSSATYRKRLRLRSINEAHCSRHW